MLETVTKMLMWLCWFFFFVSLDLQNKFQQITQSLSSKPVSSSMTSKPTVLFLAVLLFFSSCQTLSIFSVHSVSLLSSCSWWFLSCHLVISVSVFDWSVYFSHFVLCTTHKHMYYCRLGSGQFVGKMSFKRLEDWLRFLITRNKCKLMWK